MYKDIINYIRYNELTRRNQNVDKNEEIQKVTNRDEINDKTRVSF